MIINYKIIKHQHYAVADAKRLEPYIKSADIISIEYAAATEAEALYLESNFQLYRKAHLLGVNTGKIARQTLNYDRPGVLQWLVMRHGKSVVYLERFSEEESEQLTKRISDLEESRVYSGCIISGDLEGAIQAKLESDMELMQIVEVRDANIVQNAETIIRPRIFELYPDFKSASELEYAVLLGSAHSPEIGLQELSDSHVEVKRLDVPEIDGYVDWEDKVRREKALFENLDDHHDLIGRMLLASAVQVVLNDNSRATAISNLIVGKMGMAEAEVLMSLLKQAPDDEKRSAVWDFFDAVGQPLPRSKGDYKRLWRELSAPYLGN